MPTRTNRRSPPLPRAAVVAVPGGCGGLHDDHDGATDPRRDLGERHKPHPIRSPENGDIAGAAEAGVAGDDDRGFAGRSGEEGVQLLNEQLRCLFRQVMTTGQTFAADINCLGTPGL